MDGLSDEWMIGFELKETLIIFYPMEILKESFFEFITGLFYFYVPDTQTSINPFIQSSMGCL
jgi:hypothetical protein